MCIALAVCRVIIKKGTPPRWSGLAGLRGGKMSNNHDSKSNNEENQVLCDALEDGIIKLQRRCNRLEVKNIELRRQVGNALSEQDELGRLCKKIGLRESS